MLSFPDNECVLVFCLNIRFIFFIFSDLVVSLWCCYFGWISDQCEVFARAVWGMEQCHCLKGFSTLIAFLTS